MENLINNSYELYQNKKPFSELIKLYYENINIFLDKNDNIIFEKSEEEVEELIEIIYYYYKNIDDSIGLSLIRLILIYYMIQKENYSVKVKATDEMVVLSPNAENMKYYIYVASNEEMINLYIIFIIFFDIQTIEKNYVCFDFEFTLRESRVNELAQQAFECSDTPIIFLWLVKIEELKDKKDYFFSKVLLNPKISKIMHGVESLDMPFIQNTLLNNDNNKINMFLEQLIETRYLCEYYKVSHNEVANKCSIYEALLYFGVLNKEHYERLEKNIYDMGPHQDLVWNIHNMGKAQLWYAFKDVLYLKQFYDKIMRLVKEQGTIYVYNTLITDLIRFIFLERKEISDIYLKCKTETDPLNIYMIKHKNTNITMINLFKLIMKDVVIPTDKTPYELDKILMVHFFKTSLTTILKKIVYSIVSHKYEIYKDKLTKFSDKMSLKFIFDYLNQYKLNGMKELFEKFIMIITSRIINVIEK